MNGVAKVYPGNCTGCGICTRTCPNHIIALRRAIDPTIVRCSNTQKARQTRVACSKGLHRLHEVREGLPDRSHQGG